MIENAPERGKSVLNDEKMFERVKTSGFVSQGSARRNKGKFCLEFCKVVGLSGFEMIHGVLKGTRSLSAR